MSARKGPKGIGRARLDLTVDPETIERLDRLVAEHGMSRGRIVDALVFYYGRAGAGLARQPKPLDGS